MEISVIIPVLNEEANIGPLIAATKNLGDCEIIVVDGGSTDDTGNQASAADVRLKSDPGRAIQQNAGARAAHEDVLLFLHADCRLQPGCLEAVQGALTDPKIVGGCFRQVIDAPGWKYRLMERGNAARVRWLGWAYGDQGIFVRKSVFDSLGGFPDLKLMEDLYFVKRLRKAGRFVTLDVPILVSARRWQKAGFLRQTIRNWTLLALAHLGVSPNRLAKFYPQMR
jgi:rSAM/selenodomain-associated transferase 2